MVNGKYEVPSRARFSMIALQQVAHTPTPKIHGVITYISSYWVTLEDEISSDVLIFNMTPIYSLIKDILKMIT